MSTSFDEIQVKALFKEAMLELFQERREEVAALLAEALEEMGLVHAIEAGRASDLVGREDIMEILDREP